jgi:TolA-binding protein
MTKTPGPRTVAMASPAKSSRLLAGLLPLVAAGCADMPAVRVVRDDIAVVSVKTDTLKAATGRLGLAVDTLERQVRTVADQMGTVRNTQGKEIDQLRADILGAIQQLSDDNRKLQAQVDALQQRINDFQDQTMLAKAAPKGDSTKAAALGALEKLFATASEDFQKGRYDLAFRGFQDVLNRDSTKVLAPKALYQMAEARYAQRNWEEARTLYKRLVRDYPKDPLTCSAWFKIGLSWQQQGRLADRDSAWSSLQQRCPGSNEAQRATDLKTQE